MTQLILSDTVENLRCADCPMNTRHTNAGGGDGSSCAMLVQRKISDIPGDRLILVNGKTTLPSNRRKSLANGLPETQVACLMILEQLSLSHEELFAKVSDLPIDVLADSIPLRAKINALELNLRTIGDLLLVDENKCDVQLKIFINEFKVNPRRYIQAIRLQPRKGLRTVRQQGLGLMLPRSSKPDVK